MTDIYNLFLELIRVSIGTQESLSRRPSDKEWKQLFEMANKQALVGICFAGVQKLPEEMRPAGMMYLKWMGLAAKIQQRNEVMNRRCVELQERLAKDGFRSCILKGQGAAVCYGSNANLRQSGDIDVWVDGSRTKIVEWVNSVIPTNEISYLHAHLPIYADTEVEVHFSPAEFYSFRLTNILNKWYDVQKEKQFTNEVLMPDGNKIIAPTAEFNLVFMLIHMQHHHLSEGVGMRQIMDYYFALRKSKLKENDLSNLHESLKNLGLFGFAASVLWIIDYVFGDKVDIGIASIETEGKELLSEIMKGGNFGHFSNDYHSDDNDTPLYRLIMGMKRNLRFLKSYPEEVLSIPIWRTWHYLWRRTKGYK